MKVVHVVRQYLPSIGGIEEVVRNLVQYQRANTNYKPCVVTLDRIFREPNQHLPRHETLDGIPVLRLSFSGSERYPWCPQVLKTLHDADLVHVHGVDFFFDFLALTHIFHQKPMLASTHGGFFHTEFAQYLKKIYFHSVTRISAAAYNRIIATSENDGDIFKQILKPSRLTVIENGVDIYKFENTASATLQPTLIYFGRWSVNKGLLETLELLANLCAQEPHTPWTITIAGREYDLTAKTILDYAVQLGIADRVRIVPSPSNEDLRALIAQASYFICMSRHEGFGIAPIEAMSAGLIPILSAIPPFQRLVKNTGVGLVLKDTDLVSQSQQITDLHTRQIKQLSYCQDYKTNARNAVQAYSWKDVAVRYTQQYDEVMELSK